jgi:DNA-binding transcriptional ArsR family regulator
MAGFAALLADRSRAGICLALLDQRAWTAGELARHVGVARSTASEHLTVLVAAGVLAEERQGRHRYVRLADSATAQLIEDLAAAVASRGSRRRCAAYARPGSSRQPAPATTTSPEHSAWRCSTRSWSGTSSTCVTDWSDAGRPDVVHRPGRRGGLEPSADVRSCAPAWTGPNAATTSVERSVPRSAPT